MKLSWQGMEVPRHCNRSIHKPAALGFRVDSPFQPSAVDVGTQISTTDVHAPQLEKRH